MPLYAAPVFNTGKYFKIGPNNNIWNKIPPPLHTRNLHSAPAFRKALKTHLSLLLCTVGLHRCRQDTITFMIMIIHIILNIKKFMKTTYANQVNAKKINSSCSELTSSSWPHFSAENKFRSAVCEIP